MSSVLKKSFGERSVFYLDLLLSCLNLIYGSSRACLKEFIFFLLDLFGMHFPAINFNLKLINTKKIFHFLQVSKNRKLSWQFHIFCYEKSRDTCLWQCRTHQSKVEQVKSFTNPWQNSLEQEDKILYNSHIEIEYSKEWNEKFLHLSNKEKTLLQQVEIYNLSIMSSLS